MIAENPGVGQDELLTEGGLSEVQGHVGVPALEDRQDGDDQVQRPRRGDRDAPLRWRGPLDDVSGQTVGSCLEVGERERVCPPRYGDRVGRARRLLGDDAIDRSQVDVVGLGLVRPLQQGPALLGAHQRDIPDRRGRLVDHRPDHAAQVADPALERRGVEQIDVVVAIQAQAVRAFDEVEEEVEVAEGLRVRPRRHGEAGEVRTSGQFFQVELDLGQGQPARVARPTESAHERTVGEILMLEGVEQPGFRLLRLRGEGSVPVEPDPEREQVDAMTHEAGDAAQALSGRRDRDHDVALAAEPAHDDLQGGQKGDERRASLPRPRGLQPLELVDADHVPVGGAAIGFQGRPRPVGRELEVGGRSGEPLEPIGFARGPRFAGLRLVEGVTAERRRRGKAGGRPLPMGPVELQDLVHDDVERPAVADDVVGAQDQDVTVAGHPDQLGADERPRHEVEGRPRILVQDVGEGLLGCGRAAKVGERRLETACGLHHHGLAFGIVAGAQRVVAGHDVVQGRSQGGGVELTRQGEAERLVERAGCSLAELGGEPDLSLRLRPGHGVRERRRPVRRGRDRSVGARAGEDADFPEGVEARREGVEDGVEVLGAVGGRQEAGEPLLDVDAEQPRMVEEQAREPVLVRRVESEPAAEGLGAALEPAPVEIRVEPVDERRGPRREVPLERRPFGFDPGQRGSRGRERQGMADEGPGEEGRSDLRERIVAEPPLAAVERIHEALGAGQDADRQPTAHHLAVGHQVGAQAQHRLHAARMHAKTRHHLVEDQGGSRVGRDAPELGDELFGQEGRAPALDRFDYDGREFRGMAADPGEALVRAVGEHDHVGDRRARDAGGGRFGTGRGLPRSGLDQDLVELAMVAAVEDHHRAAARHGPGDAHRRHHGFRASVAEGDALVSRQAADPGCDVPGEDRLGPDGETRPQLLRDRIGDEVGRVAEERLAVAVDQIDIAVAVDVPDLRPSRSLAQDRIDEFFPLAAKARRGTRVGQDGAMGLRRLFRARRPGAVAHRQIVDEQALRRRQRIGGCGPRGAVDLETAARRRVGCRCRLGDGFRELRRRESALESRRAHARRCDAEQLSLLREQHLQGGELLRHQRVEPRSLVAVVVDGRNGRRDDGRHHEASFRRRDDLRRRGGGGRRGAGGLSLDDPLGDGFDRGEVVDQLSERDRDAERVADGGDDLGQEQGVEPEVEEAGAAVSLADRLSGEVLQDREEALFDVAMRGCRAWVGERDGC